MKDEHSRIRTLKQRWDDEDAARDKQEERAQQIFLEEEANQTFAPIEGYFTRLSKVLSAAGVSVEIDTTWQHLGDRRLRPVGKITPATPCSDCLSISPFKELVFSTATKSTVLRVGSTRSYGLSPPTWNSFSRANIRRNATANSLKTNYTRLDNSTPVRRHGSRRIDRGEQPQFEIEGWERQRNDSAAHIKWMFTIDKARAKMTGGTPGLSARAKPIES